MRSPRRWWGLGSFDATALQKKLSGKVALSKRTFR
jgi:hypothetical protein